MVLVAFRIAALISALPRSVRWVFLPYVVLYRVLFEWVLGIELPWKLKIGRNCRLYHGQSLVVSDRSVIGCNCVLRHSTTIGVSVTSSDFTGSAPVIGNYVDIGSNVVILGNVSVGDGAVIGAGSVVVDDVPAGAVVVGNPARVIRIASAAEDVSEL